MTRIRELEQQVASLEARHRAVLDDVQELFRLAVQNPPLKTNYATELDFEREKLGRFRSLSSAFREKWL